MDFEIKNSSKKKMIDKIEEYYRDKVILSTNFECSYKKECGRQSEKFYGPKSAFISSGYEKGTLPRLLILSLDPGSSEENPSKRLPIAVREFEETRDISLLHKGRHWYRTHELAFHILRQFKDDLNIEDVKHYFAHVNTVKCSMNNPYNKQADKMLFKNCRGYLEDEIVLMRPDIIVTQGLEAKKALEQIIPETHLSQDRAHHIINLNGRKVFWLQTVHPSNYGAFHKQFNKGKGWDKYAREIYQWYQER